MPNASELLEGTTQKPHDFTGRIVNGQRTCRFCCCMQTEAIAIGPTCAQPLSDTERQVTQLEAQLAEVREVKVTNGMLEAALQAHYGRDGWRWDDGLTEGMRLVYQTKMEAALTAALLTKEPK